MQTLKIRSFDPGKHQDTFAMIEFKIDIRTQTVIISGAFGWKHDNYTKCEKDISEIHKKDPADFYVCEQNNTGTHVIDSLQNIFHIPVTGINTGRTTNEKTKKKGKTMDKDDIVKSVKALKKLGKLKIVKTTSPGLKTFVKQLNSFIKKMTPGGKITYAAEGTGHDDFVMAFLVGMHYILHNFIKSALKHMSTSVNRRKDIFEDHVGSGIPEGSKLIGSNIIYPGHGGGGQF